jgi:hypothetical protein
VNLGFRYIDFHSFIAAGSLMYIGLNTLAFAAITRVYGFQAGLLPRAPRFFRLFKYINLEKGLATGFLLICLGLLLMGRALQLSGNFEQIGFDNSVRLVFGGSLALVSGVQVIWTSFVLSMLGLGIHHGWHLPGEQ